jgi:hypothetical protein
VIPRAIAITLGVLLLAAGAHVTIEATGGYGTPHSYVTMAVAAGVAGGSIFGGMAYAAGRHLLTASFVACIIAGELFGFLQSANRLVAGTEATQAPLREHAEAYSKAAKRVEVAKAAVDKLPLTSERLTKAEAAKKAADDAVVSKAAEKGCRENCRQLLQAQADAAATEIAAARSALDSSNQRARDELAAARSALAGQRAPQSATPLSDRTGIPAWLLDLFGAGFGAVAANGLAACLMIFGGHQQRRAPHVEVIAPDLRVAGKPLVTPARKARARRPKAVARTMTAEDRAAQFALECLQPQGEADIEAVESLYASWAASRPIQQEFPRVEIGNALGRLMKESGIAIEERDGRLIAVGISLKGPPRLTVVPSA